MNEITAIAGSTMRRVLRMRVVYFLIICVLILIGSAVNYDILSMGEERALMIDVSLVLNTVAAVLVAISITFEIPKELREGVASTLLSKPLGRTHYLLGKLLGTIGTGLVVTSIIGVGFLLIYSISFDVQVAKSIVQGQLLVILSVIPMAGLAVFFSIIIPDMLAALVTAAVIWLCHSTAALKKVLIVYGGIIPDLDLFNLKAQAVYSTEIHWDYILLTLVWGIVFTIFVTTLASLIFSHKDLK